MELWATTWFLLLLVPAIFSGVYAGYKVEDDGRPWSLIAILAAVLSALSIATFSPFDGVRQWVNFLATCLWFLCLSGGAVLGKALRSSHDHSISPFM